jgi:hypothetical protein
MALHRLDFDEFYDDSFTLIAIHSQIEDYRLAYFLNKKLNLKLKRCEKDLDFKYFTASFPFFEYRDPQQCRNWYLIANSCTKETESFQSSGSLFDFQQKAYKTHFLVPEYKTVNYFLKVEEEAIHFDELSTIKTIVDIPKIVTSYKVDAEKLKSKNHLIF